MKDGGHPRYEPIVVGPESTVVAEYLPAPVLAEGHQSEAELEREFIGTLMGQAYEYLRIQTEQDLVANLRAQISRLNGLTFSDAEWQRFFASKIAGQSESVEQKTFRIQEDYVQLLTRDDGSTQNVKLIDKVHVHNNHLQVLNQYEIAEGAGGAARTNRYDVTVLVNGLPMVHVELKRRGENIREAFNQIQRYQRDSFWAGSGLFDYVQLFVISNGTHTKYYSNTTRRQHLKEAQGKRQVRVTSNSYEFTSWWADANNRRIKGLIGFAKTFFAKHALLAILTRYCVLNADGLLLVLRPYQIAATERILNRIEVAKNARILGGKAAGGYIWHTTGSGKTLTSFKTAQLATRLEGVQKVLFVVDRKDLDYQTMIEYDRFEKGAANSNNSTAVLKKQLEDPQARIIVTTIQKLSRFIERNKGHKVYEGQVVLIFDECHRSQFGDMHKLIVKAFKRYNLFGFTGTPIFADNAPSGVEPDRRTTEQVFGEKLHAYTLVDAINDKNVLPFRIDYVNTMKAAPTPRDQKVTAIDTERALLAPERISQVVRYILDHFEQKTRRTKSYQHRVLANVTEMAKAKSKVTEQRRTQRLMGFNSLLATASIDSAKLYYAEFKRQQAEIPAGKRLKVGLIYSFAPNEADDSGAPPDENFDTSGLDASARDFLDAAITDYNAYFGTSYDTSADKFENYYKDMSLRLKNRELDLGIVVNMFLTGFDATTLNTLWVDKNLRYHGLIQAFSRTNRILNRVKTYGNIVCFRDLDQATNDAIALFGNKDARGVVLLKAYADYFADYIAKVDTLVRDFPLDDMPIDGEASQKEFVKLFGGILRLRNILTSFDDFEGEDTLGARQLQDYKSEYLDLYDAFRKQREADEEGINDDVIFEIELVKQVEVTVDYILMMVQAHREKRGDGEDRTLKAEILRAVDSSPGLRDKRDLIEDFLARVNTSPDIDEEWRQFVISRRDAELDTIIQEERLKAAEARAFMEAAYRDGGIQRSGTAITKVLPPVSRFSPDKSHGAVKQRVLDKLGALHARFAGLVAEPE